MRVTGHYYQFTKESLRSAYYRHFRAVFEYVHDQFPAVVKGNAELVIAVIQPVALVVGMPAFVGHPLCCHFSKSMSAVISQMPRRILMNAN